MKTKLTLSILILALLSSTLLSKSLPKKPKWVNDLAKVLTAQEERELTSYLQSVEQKNGTQIVVLTIKSLKGESIEDYSMKVAEKWEIGQEKLDNGVLLLVSVQDHKLRIEVGYGLEGALTDAKCDYIIRKEIVPHFKSNDYGTGIKNGIHTIGAIALNELTLTDSEVEQFNRSHPQGESGGGFIFFLIILFIILRVAGAIFPRNTGWFIFDILLMIGRSGGGGGGSSGGFSGGGGSFGGGGASGSW